MFDRERWEAEAAGPPSWDDRSRCVAGFIRAGESVLDLGAGARGLRAHLPSGGLSVSMLANWRNEHAILKVTR